MLQPAVAPRFSRTSPLCAVRLRRRLTPIRQHSLRSGPASGELRDAGPWCGGYVLVRTEPVCGRRRATSPEQGRRADAEEAGSLAARSGRVLLQLLRTDLRRGYWRVAVRHYLMLVACAYEFPESLREQCLHRIRNCTPRQLEKISARVTAWHTLLLLGSELTGK